MAGSTAWVMHVRPRTLVAIIRRQSSVSAPTTGPSSISPAALTSTSTPPSSEEVRSTAAARLASSLTSISRARAVPPAPRTSCTTEATRSARRAPSATEAPARARARAVAAVLVEQALPTAAVER